MSGTDPKCKKKLMGLGSSESTTTEKPSRLAALEAEDDTECIFCGKNFHDNWIQCYSCKGWAHEGCASTDPSDIFYNGDVCIDKGSFKVRH
ncbi:hypothetical protein PR048_029085 [Dryococelus australis]|uniref:Zinc finger PHD-type domain-containing protein n=1 Tax=Dryococelus australis TaxID=614101 RepID=A0ABQ9GFT6_9NEOP|nr:hypothetical protein PR048_029085 [Dryococelus australis]